MSDIQKALPSFTVWVFDHDTAQHHDNDVKADTVASLDVATAIARCRVQDTNHSTGYANIVDNNIAGQMGDRGNVLHVGKKSDGVTVVTNKRSGVEPDDIQARPSKVYIGPIVTVIGDEFAVQEIGRQRPILHQLSKLNSHIKVGDMITIKYNSDGRGNINPLSVSKDVAVSR